jgi:hypothetical protein
VASTYPLELVQVSQWMQRNPGLHGPLLTQAAQQHAFLNQQGDVMEAVQRMRQKAQQGGKLTSTRRMTQCNPDKSWRSVVLE